MSIGELFSPVMHTKGFLGIVDRIWMGLNRLGIIFSIIIIIIFIIALILLYPTIKKNGYIKKSKNIIINNLKTYKTFFNELHNDIINDSSY